ncbi:sulfatase [Flavivirga rizhaonensis]|uniref:Sulfatase n=1 Tax=Flavivirga rizhaonensis TaxID=2559571 RepID=A0A4S1DWI5_9FLAO|nr:sulfatase [Flavivirga rizhaonensis]TGV01868.1 sulfatase [Flavivirga rizhaonensis]
MKLIYLNITLATLCSILVFSCKNKEESAAQNTSVKQTTIIPKPNIVLLFIDDWGWSDIGYRNATFQTPNLNQFKKESLDFQRAYIPTPTCSPSRASLLTGKESVRLEMSRHIPEEKHFINSEYNIWPKDPMKRPSRNYLPHEEVTYAEKLKEYGYYNMFIGKWHLGDDKYYPEHQGFDKTFGTTDNGHPKNYYYPFFKSGDPKGFQKNFKEGDYLTDVLTDGAVDFIKNYDKTQPFMLSFWYYSVHGPSIGRKDLLKKYQDAGLEGKYAHHAAMVEAMDESIGRVRKAIKDKGIADNTIVIVLSDQGGAYENTPLSGGKKGGNTLGEGGARVPFIVNYPSITKANTETSIPVQSIDVFPTLMEIASGEKYQNENIQGVSLLPILKGEAISPRNLYFFRSYEDQYAAVISGDWKLIKYHSGKFHLFNVVEDISENNNLIGKGLEIENQLKKEIANWEKEAVPIY